MQTVHITLHLRPGSARQMWEGEITTSNGGVVLSVRGPHATVIEALKGWLTAHDPRGLV